MITFVASNEGCLWIQFLVQCSNNGGNLCLREFSQNQMNYLNTMTPHSWIEYDQLLLLLTCSTLINEIFLYAKTNSIILCSIETNQPSQFHQSQQGTQNGSELISNNHDE